MPKLTRNRAVLRVRLHKVRLSVRQCLQMSTEGCRRRVGLSRLYHGSIMYLSRHRLWVSIMYLSGVVHTNSSHAHSRRLCIVGTRTSSAPTVADVLPEPVGNCRWRSVWTTSTRAGDLAPVGTERCRVLSGLTSAWERAACVMYAIMWCLAKATRDCYHSAYIWVSLYANNHIMVSLMCVFKL